MIGRRPRCPESSRPRWARRLVGPVLPLAIAVSGCDFQPGPRGAVGAASPLYEAASMDGARVSLEDYRGDVVLLNIWATWCPPCRTEVPELQALHETYGDQGLRVVGVSVDAAGTEQAVQQFIGDFGMTYDVLRDPSDRVTGLFGFPGIPGTVLIGRDGTVLWRHLGPVTADDPRLLQALESAL